jgi:hypothetical protein
MFKKGDIVRLSELGRMKFGKVERSGRVLGVSSTGSQVKVQWDGLRTSYLIHKSYLARATDGSSPVHRSPEEVGFRGESLNLD